MTTTKKTATVKKETDETKKVKKTTAKKTAVAKKTKAEGTGTGTKKTAAVKTKKTAVKKTAAKDTKAKTTATSSANKKTPAKKTKKPVSKKNVEKKDIVEEKIQEQVPSQEPVSAVEQISQPKEEVKQQPREVQKQEHPKVVKNEPEKKEQPKVFSKEQVKQSQPQTPVQQKQPAQQQQPPKVEPKKEEPKEPEKPALPKITINELITVKELAEKMNLKVGDVLRKLMTLGTLATINQRLDTDTAILLANEFGYDANLSSLYEEEENIETSQKDDEANLLPRSPIVTIMGHVDHGKTSLLDAIRHSNVIAGEAGGITQHIGAYRVKTSTGEITFLDTPGHEAFTAMRSRGAQVTDIVILVVSAADGVMPQTIEAINHAKAAKVPIIVAVNKIDLPEADPQRIRQEISNYGLLPEEWGGDTIMVDISAKQKMNIDSLLELVQLKAEMMELKANPNRRAEGIVIEAKLDHKKGTVVTMLVQNGTLRVGDNIVVGTTYGKVRAMANEYSQRFNEAIPSMPVEVLGINEPPQAGDKFIVLEHESQAREIANARKEKAKADSLKPRQHLSLLDINTGKRKI